MDKRITIWNFIQNVMILSIEPPDIPILGVHSIVFSNSYQILLTAGFENLVNLFQINPLYQDYTLIDKLKGDAGMVTAIEVIESTPVILTADDQGIIKLWDIRNCKCI